MAATIPTLLYSIATHAKRPPDIYVVYDHLPAAAKADLTWFNDRFPDFRVILPPLRAADRDLLRRFTLGQPYNFLSAGVAPTASRRGTADLSRR